MEYTYCPDCGTRLMEGKRFCVQCGAAVPVVSESVSKSQHATAVGAAAVGPPPTSFPPPAQAARKSNPWAVAGLIMGILSIVFYQIGMLPLATVAVCVVGLTKAKDYGGRGIVLAAIGLVLGIVYSLMYLAWYGHLG